MSQEVEQALREIDARFQDGQLSELEYKEAKWNHLHGLCDTGHLLSFDYYAGDMQEIADNNGKEYVFVGKGPFVFGPDDEFCELKAPIYIAKYPVTVAEFSTFLDDAGYDFPEADREAMNLVSPDPNCPVSHISWIDAKEYCRWLRKVNCEYYSLPHEIEWERAARGIDGRFYPWGNDDPTEDRACYRDPVQYDGTVPVDRFPTNASPVGCIGMVGNVWEWCLDTVKDPRDPHILRGGSWCNPSQYANCISRTFCFPPDKRIDFGGFRLIYLPHDMLVEYRQQYAGGITSKGNLTVVTHARRKGKVLEMPTGPAVAREPVPAPPKITPKRQPRPERPAAPAPVAASPTPTDEVPIASAAAAAAPPSEAEVELNELMAEAISEAAAIYRRSLNKEASPEEGEKPKLEIVDEAAKEKGKPKLALASKGKPAAPEPKGRPPVKGKPGVKGKQPVMSGDAAAMTKLGKVAIVAWTLLLLGIVGLCVQRFMSLS